MKGDGRHYLGRTKWCCVSMEEKKRGRHGKSQRAKELGFFAAGGNKEVSTKRVRVSIAIKRRNKLEIFRRKLRFSKKNKYEEKRRRGRVKLKYSRLSLSLGRD